MDRLWLEFGTHAVLYQLQMVSQPAQSIENIIVQIKGHPLSHPSHLRPAQSRFSCHCPVWGARSSLAQFRRITFIALPAIWISCHSAANQSFHSWQGAKHPSQRGQFRQGDSLSIGFPSSLAQCSCNLFHDRLDSITHCFAYFADYTDYFICSFLYHCQQFLL